ncbi:MAG: M3 family metallopeptidase [Gammaproteobacteria bacterium]|nr:M3 family metallopeptidase [Gammaproteobacteria bacterium]
MNQQPFFAPLDTQHYEMTLKTLLKSNKEKITNLLTQKQFTFENLIHPIDEMSNELHILWAQLSHSHHVIDTEEVRELYNKCLPLLSDYQSELGQNIDLFNAFKQIANDPHFENETPEKRKMITDSLRDFHLSGIELNEEKKKLFRDLDKKLSELSSRFAENVLDATQAWIKPINSLELLVGLPSHTLSYAAKKAVEHKKEGWVLTLEMPCYQAVMTCAENRELRREMYTAFVSRASELDAPAFDNTTVMQEILSLRHQMANLLGFHDYAELSLATKMLKKPEEVLKFLNELADLARPFAQKEIQTLEAFAKEEDDLEKLEAWDLAYYSEKLQKKLFDFTNEELRPYFPEEKVLTGLFDLVFQLYGIQIEAIEPPSLWHPDVKCYCIKNLLQEPMGYFYLDLYARAQKRGGAWMDDYCSRYRQLSGNLQLPIAFLVCNFTPPDETHPSLLTHDDVLTLFHEFGHGLHHLLTQVDILEISGISGVEWDAVELPSQFMENFCWEKSVLDKIAVHYKTGQPLPASLYTQLRASKNFQSAMQLMRQLEFALFDFHLHLDFQMNLSSDFIQNILNTVRAKVSVTPVIEANRFQHGFSHIFAGGYAAGYYSYKWAEVLSSDVYALFAEKGVISTDVGQHFLETLLSRGGSDTAMNLFKAFRGREPHVDALLEASGLK